MSHNGDRSVLGASGHPRGSLRSQWNDEVTAQPPILGVELDGASKLVIDESRDEPCSHPWIEWKLHDRTSLFTPPDMEISILDLPPDFESTGLDGEAPILPRIRRQFVEYETGRSRDLRTKSDFRPLE